MLHSSAELSLAQHVVCSSHQKVVKIAEALRKKGIKLSSQELDNLADEIKE